MIKTRFWRHICHPPSLPVFLIFDRHLRSTKEGGIIQWVLSNPSSVLWRPNRLPMRPITPEKQLILEDLFKGGGQDSSSLKGTRETFSLFWDIVGLVPVFSLGSDYIWIFCFSLSWSLGLVFCPTLDSCCLQGVSLHHGSHLPCLLHELSHTHSHSISLSLSLFLPLPLESVYCKTRNKSYWKG
jgi:hypothetical protein